MYSTAVVLLLLEILNYTQIKGTEMVAEEMVNMHTLVLLLVSEESFGIIPHTARSLFNVISHTDISLTPVTRVQCSNTSEVLSYLEMGMGQSIVNTQTM